MVSQIVFLMLPLGMIFGSVTEGHLSQSQRVDCVFTKDLLGQDVGGGAREEECSHVLPAGGPEWWLCLPSLCYRLVLLAARQASKSGAEVLGPGITSLFRKSAD